MKKPDWRCLLHIHSWEKFVSSSIEVRRCRRCAITDRYHHGYPGGEWNTIEWGQIKDWKEYQEQQRYARLSPELKPYVDETMEREARRNTAPVRTSPPMVKTRPVKTRPVDDV